MKKSAFFASALLCTLPFLFAFENAAVPYISSKGITVKAEPVAQQKAFVLRLANLEKKPLRINITDDKRRALYAEKVLDHNGYRKLISLRYLNDGEYQIMILHPKESRTGTITVSAKTVEIAWDQAGWQG